MYLGKIQRWYLVCLVRISINNCPRTNTTKKSMTQTVELYLGYFNVSWEGMGKW